MQLNLSKKKQKKTQAKLEGCRAVFQHQSLELLPYFKWQSLKSKCVKNCPVFYRCKILEKKKQLLLLDPTRSLPVYCDELAVTKSLSKSQDSWDGVKASLHFKPCHPHLMECPKVTAATTTDQPHTSPQREKTKHPSPTQPLPNSL